MTQKPEPTSLPSEVVKPDEQQLIDMDEFIKYATHQLRTPATAVKQYIGMLLGGYMGPLTDRQLKFLQSAYDSNERELQIINDLPRMARNDEPEHVKNTNLKK